MRIRDLPDPVTASKADWLPATTWLGFTPQGTGPNAPAQCASAVRQQFGNGYVLERITQMFGNPNKGYENDPEIAEERETHRELKDRLIAVHRLRHSMRPLIEIVGGAEFERLQDIWSTDDTRQRWSVAFPIVESYEIVGKPEAKEIFPPELFARIYRSQSATLRLLDDAARAAIADLEIARVDAPNAWIAIEDELAMAERSELNRLDARHIARDLIGALEGESEERKVRIKTRATWLAGRFASARRKAGTLICDACGFNPADRDDLNGVPYRSCFDVHHKDPLAEGKRYTNVNDFSLLCPTCHRLEHLRLKRDR